MRYPASEKLEIIRLVEESALPVRRTLERIGIPHATFYRWYDLYQTGGPEALEDQQPTRWGATTDNASRARARGACPFLTDRTTTSLLRRITHGYPAFFGIHFSFSFFSPGRGCRPARQFFCRAPTNSRTL
jgi:transposase-like protein